MKAVRYTLSVTVLTVLGVLTARYLLEEESPAPQQMAAAPAPAAPPAPPPAAPAAPQAPPAPLLPSPALADLEDEHGEFTTDTDILKQRIFRTEPQLARFHFFREHVLLDSNGREDYRKLLSDPAMYAQLRRELLQPASPGNTMENSVKRLMQVDYLREALHLKDNPERENLVSTVEAIILEDSFSASMSEEVKRSVAASKMELFEILHGHEPERAQALVATARGTRLEQLLEYIDGYNQRRLELERQVSVQAMKQSATP